MEGISLSLCCDGLDFGGLGICFLVSTGVFLFDTSTSLLIRNAASRLHCANLLLAFPHRALVRVSPVVSGVATETLDGSRADRTLMGRFSTFLASGVLFAKFAGMAETLTVEAA